MNVSLRFTDGSSATFHGQFLSEENFWEFYKETIALETPFIFSEAMGKKHCFNLKAVVSVVFT